MYSAINFLSKSTSWALQMVVMVEEEGMSNVPTLDLLIKFSNKCSPGSHDS